MISEDPGFQVSSHNLQSLNSWKRLQPQQSLNPLGNEHTVTGSPSESHVQWSSGPYMITVWHYRGSSRNYFQYNTSVIFTSPEWFLLPNIKQKSKVQCFLLSKVSSFGAELGHLLLSNWVSYEEVHTAILRSSRPNETFFTV